MLKSIVLRNIIRSRRRLLPLIIAIVLTFAGLLLGNGVLTSSNESLYDTYASYISGDMSISAAADSNFTIFGSDALLVGEYQVPPTLLNFEELQEQVDALPGVRSSVPVITAAARVEIGSRRSNHTVIGVDFERYQEVFEDLEIVDGRFPESGERAVLVQEGWGTEAIGEPAVLSAAFDSSFAVREARVAGVFRFPISDEQLNRVVIADAVTARALNGYVGGIGGGGEVPEAEQEALDSDLDDLFGDPDSYESDSADSSSSDSSGSVPNGDDAENGDDTQESDNSGSSVSNDDDLFGERDDFGDEGGEGAESSSDSSSVPEGQPDNEPDRVAEIEAFFERSQQASSEEADDHSGDAEATAGVWNFLLLSLHDRDDTQAVERALASAGFSGEDGYNIESWRGTVGGNAEIAWYLQLMFNAGIFFVALGAAMITTNALVLSVLERTGEIGTMRALGATRTRVSTMIVLETALTVVGAALLGILAGAVAIGVLNASDPVINNPYIDTLFGGEPVNAVLTLDLVLFHIVGAFALALIAVIYPLKRALAISPVEAMSA